MENNAFVLYLESTLSPASFAIFKSFFSHIAFFTKNACNIALKFAKKSIFEGNIIILPTFWNSVHIRRVIMMH